MSKKTMEDLKYMLCDELDEITAKGTLSAGDLDSVQKLTSSIKNICKIMESDDYSEDGGWRAEGNYSRDGSYRGGNSYDRDMSYRRGRRANGRYYSMAEGKDAIVERIQEMMQEGGLSAEEKNALRKAMDVLK